MQRNAILSEKKPIFIVGTPRSGTTMVGRILGEHPDIFLTRESFFFEDIWSRKKELGELNTVESVQKAVDRFLTLFGRFEFVETQNLVDQYIESDQLTSAVLEKGGGFGVLYFELMSQLALSQNKSLFCDDTPRHLYHLETILNFFPNAKIIGVSRDPRDFLCSYKNYWHHSEHAERMKSLYHPISTSLLWKSSAKLMQKYTVQYPDNFLRVNYEKIVHNPKMEINRICEFLNVSFSSNLLDIRESNSSFTKSTKTSGIFPTSIGRWQNCLTQEELWIINSLNQQLMISQKYEPVNSSPSFFKLLKFVTSFPFQVVRALQMNRQYRAPLLIYLVKRLFSLS